MRFVWPAQRYDRLTKWSAALATGFTVVACVLIALALVTGYRAAQSSSVPSHDEQQEIVSFMVQVPAGLAVKRAAEVTPRAPERARARPASRSIDRERTSPSPGSTESAPIVDTVSRSVVREAAPASTAIGPVLAPAAFSKVMNLSEAARDSLNKAQAEWLRKRYMNFDLTPEQKDSAAREQSQRAVASRDDHRPIAIPLLSLPFHLPFGGGGKSRDQQRKDSIINADNLQRLARLADRARAKRDSTMRATLAAKRDTDDRRDSLTRLGRPRP